MLLKMRRVLKLLNVLRLFICIFYTIRVVIFNGSIDEIDYYIRSAMRNDL